MTALERDRVGARDGATRAVPIGDVRYKGYDELVQELPAEPQAPVPYARPEHPRRPWSGVALALPLVALAATRPFLGFGALLAIIVVCRVVATSGDALHRRREHHGTKRGSDGIIATLLFPWHALVGALGVIPAALVGACAGMLAVLASFWLFGAGHVIILPRMDIEARSVGGMNEDIVFNTLLAVAMVIALAATWFGPAGRTAREGGRMILARLAPGPWGAVAFVVVCLVVTGVLVAPLLGGATTIDWWPLEEQPEVL
jgi:hypothetical protein